MKKIKDIINEASPLLGKMINMGGRRAKVTAIAKQGDSRYNTDYEIRFLDDNTKTVMSDPMVRAFMESVELDEYRRSDVYVIVDKKGKVVAANLTKKNAHKEISRHRDGTIVLDPDAKTGDVLKTFAKESVELDEDNTAAIARQVKQAVKKYVTGTPRVQSKGGKVRFIMLRADKIDNKLRKMVLDVEHPNANVKNMDDIHYANISDRIISAGVDVWIDALGLKESTEVEEVANVVANVAGVAPGDIPPVKKKRKKFAGCEVFEVDCDEYSKFMTGSRSKNERWSRRLNMENLDNQEIKHYAHKNPGKAIIIQDKTTGMMCYLKPSNY